MKLSLGSLLVDTNVVRIDEVSYKEMHEFGDATDMDVIEKAWKEQDNKYVKTKRDNTEGEEKDGKKKAKVVINGYDYGRNGTNMGGDSSYSSDDDSKEEKENRINGAGNEKKKTAESKSAKKVGRVEEEESKECKECCEEPCVWIMNREHMIEFDSDEHNHLPDGAGPPNNIRRKKVYR